VTIQNEIKRSSFPRTRTDLPALADTTARTGWDTQPHPWQECRYSVAVTNGLMAAIEGIPAHCSREDAQERLWDVLWKASLSARRAKPGCSRIVFEVMLPIEGNGKISNPNSDIRPAWAAWNDRISSRFLQRLFGGIRFISVTRLTAGRDEQPGDALCPTSGCLSSCE
jgi:hypothetical protein